MAARILCTVLSLLLAAGAFWGAGPAPAGINLFGVLFLFVAVIAWFDWATIRESHFYMGEDGEHRPINPMMVRLGPLLPLLLTRSERDEPRGK